MTTTRRHRLILRIIMVVVCSVFLAFKQQFLDTLTSFGWAKLASLIEVTVETSFWLAVGLVSVSFLDFFIWRGMEIKTGRSLPKLMKDIINATILVVIFLTIMAYVFNIPISGLIAGSSVMAAIVGLAVTRMISDVFSGVALSLEGAYSIGDWLEVELRTRPGGVITGKVVEINWRATRMLTKAEEVVVIPNSEIARTKFINFSIPHRHYRAEVQVHLSHRIPSKRVRRIFNAAIMATPEVMTEYPSEIILLRFDPRGVTWAVRFWVKDYALHSQVVQDMHENILKHLQVAGIDLSYQRIDQRVLGSGMEQLKKKPMKTELIKRIELFEVLDEKHVKSLADSMHERIFSPKQIIFTQNQEGASLFMVAEGLVSIFLPEEDGRDKWVSFIEPGKYFGEMSLLTGQPRTASAQAETEVICYEITKDTISAIIQEQPAILAKLSRVMAERQVSLNKISETEEMQQVEAEKEKNTNWLLQRMQSFFGIKTG